ncbi:hypothetical protein [Ruminococcus flavefaciens]|uniref:putative ABC transporter permease n=1 Tax=Ruminococcus flavefaciens TaxID=1265 RepID=UPI001567BB05|nr:hypothetical protein [Ruminococcus flavefaciens]
MNATLTTVYQTACFFVIYAFFGWCLEVVYQAVEHGKFINRGFLNGPYCPIYGFGVIIVCGALEPIKENLIVLYLGAVILTSTLEFITGFLLEKIFRRKWWDYTGERFNLKGYICLKFSLLWGVACLVTVRLIHPLVTAFVEKLPQTLGIMILSVILIGFLSDAVITVCAIIHIRNRLILTERISTEMRKISDATGEKLFSGVEFVMDKKNDLDEKANEHRKKLEELAAKYRKLTEKRELTLKRLAKAFPKLSLESTAELKERFAKIKDELKRK